MRGNRLIHFFIGLFIAKVDFRQPICSVQQSVEHTYLSEMWISFAIVIRITHAPGHSFAQNHHSSRPVPVLSFSPDSSQETNQNSIH
jgi:hypothetical protein